MRIQRLAKQLGVHEETLREAIQEVVESYQMYDWMEWNGESQPFQDGIRVDVELSQGTFIYNIPCNELINWENVVKYRLARKR